MSASADIVFEMLDDMSADDLVTLRIVTPVGVLLVMGEPTIKGRTMIARRVHMHGVGVGVNELGATALRAIADRCLKELNLDELVVEGAVRTTGAKPGTRPRPVRFTRRAGTAPRSDPGEC